MRIRVVEIVNSKLTCCLGDCATAAGQMPLGVYKTQESGIVSGGNAEFCGRNTAQRGANRKYGFIREQMQATPQLGF